MKYLIAYDIPDDKRRAKLFKFLLGYGFNVELSVFEIEVNAGELSSIVQNIKEIINLSEDSVYIFPFGGEPIRNGIYKNKSYGDIFI
ncbi:CRISPR-associated endonuclease Cas2 [Persephonella sp.]